MNFKKQKRSVFTSCLNKRRPRKLSLEVKASRLQSLPALVVKIHHVFLIQKWRYAMPRDEQEDDIIYKVVINLEEQYSIWPVDRENALGWGDVGKRGPKDECLTYIKEVWTNMQPLSLRKRVNEAAKQN